MKSITLTLIRRVSVSKLATCRIQGLIPDYTHFFSCSSKLPSNWKTTSSSPPFNARIGLHLSWFSGDRTTEDPFVDQDGKRWRYMLRLARWYLLNGNLTALKARAGNYSLGSERDGNSAVRTHMVADCAAFIDQTATEEAKFFER